MVQLGALKTGPRRVRARIRGHRIGTRPITRTTGSTSDLAKRQGGARGPAEVSCKWHLREGPPQSDGVYWHVGTLFVFLNVLAPHFVKVLSFWACFGSWRILGLLNRWECDGGLLWDLFT
jgi:hypothetical protein